MSLDDEHWTQCTPSEYAWERAALTYLRDQLRNSGIHRGWSNAEFLGQDENPNSPLVAESKDEGRNEL